MDCEITNHGNVIEAPLKNAKHFERGLPEYFFKELNKHRSLPLQIDGLTGEIDTYGSFLQRSVRTALKIRARGITSQDYVTVCSDNHLNTLVPLIASLFVGVKTASIDPVFTLSESVHLLDIIKPKLIFASLDGARLVEDALEEAGLKAEIVVFGKSERYVEFSEFLEKVEDEEDFVPVKTESLKETAFMVFSSGTTGFSKGILINHLSLYSQINLFKHSLSKSDFKNYHKLRTLNYSNPYWLLSMMFLSNAVETKSCQVILPKFDPESFWNCIGTYKVQLFVLTPPQLETICKYKRPEHIDSTVVKAVISTGGHASKRLVEMLYRTFPQMQFKMTYGQSELGGECFQFDVNSDDYKYLRDNPDSCGRPQPGYSYKVVEVETEEPLGPNQTGELRVKTYALMNGYKGVDSSSLFDSDNFVKTSDLAYYDENFCFYVIGRQTDILNYRGCQIAPQTLESILRSHPQVQDAVVIGLPHPVDTVHPAGVVQLKTSANNVSVVDILKYYEKHINDDNHKLRGGLKVIDMIPQTTTGKYRKNYLRELIIQGRL